MLVEATASLFTYTRLSEVIFFIHTCFQSKTANGTIVYHMCVCVSVVSLLFSFSAEIFCTTWQFRQKRDRWWGLKIKCCIIFFWDSPQNINFCVFFWRGFPNFPGITDWFDNDGFLLPWKYEWIKFVYVSHLRHCSLVSVLQPSKRYKSKYLGFSVDRNEILWSQYLTCMKLCVLNFLWNMQCPRLAINSVKKRICCTRQKPRKADISAKQL